MVKSKNASQKYYLSATSSQTLTVSGGKPSRKTMRMMPNRKTNGNSSFTGSRSTNAWMIGSLDPDLCLPEISNGHVLNLLLEKSTQAWATRLRGKRRVHSLC